MAGPWFRPRMVVGVAKPAISGPRYPERMPFLWPIPRVTRLYAPWAEDLVGGWTTGAARCISAL